VEENPRKLPDLITAAARYTQHDPALEIDEQSKEYWKWRDTILYAEEHLLEALCFDFDVTHPYEYLTKLVHRFCSGNSVLGKCAWAFINDRYGSRGCVVVCTSVFMVFMGQWGLVVLVAPQGSLAWSLMVVIGR